MDKTQKRWSFIVNIIYLLIFVGAFYLFMKYAFWTLFPFMCAFVIAALLQKPLRFLTKNKHVPKGIVSTVLSLLVYAVIIGLIAVVGVKLVSSVRDLITYFTDRCSNFAEFFDIIKNGYLNLDLADRLPSYVNDYVISLIDELNDYVVNGELVSAITSNISKLVSPLGSVISTVPSFLAAFLIAIVSTCFMTVEYSKLKAFVVRQLSPERRLNASKTKHILISSVGKMCRAYGLIILITTCELYIGLNILKLIGVNSGTHNLLISFLTALVDIVPVLGTGTVVIPWSLYCFITGNIGMGIGLLVIYVVITVIRQIIEPKLVAGQVGISPIVTIMAMYIGIKLFGAIGIFILPFFVIIIKLLNDEGIIHLFVSDPEDTANKSEETESEGFF
ncbi:MAG: sporulation integral membrane protein YtvI [Clostridiales bacterium]|nr:sporulation integral membrane protein YtvI [Clostridiales bacterium]